MAHHPLPSSLPLQNHHKFCSCIVFLLLAVLGVTRYKVMRYCKSTTFSSNKHVTKYIF